MKSNSLAWPNRPQRTTHRTLGRRTTFRSRCGRYRIDRFAGGSGLWIVTRAAWPPEVLGTHRSLRAARRTCARDARVRAPRRTTNPVFDVTAYVTPVQ